MAESLYFKTNDGENLHVRLFTASHRKHEEMPVLLIHGAIENGRIFYSDSGKGLAPYLASQGFDCYVLDLRGRGKSTPAISKSTKHGQTEIILEDIPTSLDAISARYPNDTTIRIVAHSWGGVLTLATLARFPDYIQKVSRIVFFGTKRSVQVLTADRLLRISFAWNTLSPILTALYGYLPAREWRLGSDQESKKSHAQSRHWVKTIHEWIDLEDGFDYKKALESLHLPPILSIMGTRDRSLGHIKDARRFLKEAKADQADYLEVPYGHIDMLTGKSAAQTVFPQVADWLKK
jgi:pimeloyl-ACP methyl ester carboxylesterase